MLLFFFCGFVVFLRLFFRMSKTHMAVQARLIITFVGTHCAKELSFFATFDPQMLGDPDSATVLLVTMRAEEVPNSFWHKRISCKRKYDSTFRLFV